MNELPIGLNDNHKRLVDNFIEHRKDIKSPFTKRGLTLFINKLQKLDKQGQDINALVELAIESCWKTIYPQNNKHQQLVKPPTVLGQNLDASKMLNEKEILELREKTRKSREQGMSKIKGMLYGRLA